MKITFLGTGAAEGVPSPFCDCATCLHARKNKGKNIRKRSSILINKDLVIDLGPDFVTAASSLGLSFSSLKYAMVTHSHFDHFHPNNLEIRSSRYIKPSPNPIHLVAGPTVFNEIDKIGFKDEDLGISRLPILPFKSVSLPPYSIYTISATHALNLGDAMNYVIDDGINKILYATDTGIYDESTFNKIADSKFKLIIIDLTNGEGKTSMNHLNIAGLKLMINRFKDIGVISNDTSIYATHFSHKKNPPHNELELSLSKLGVFCSYDGLIVNI